MDAEHLASLRPELLRYASLQLRNDALAEDVVQEVLLAALSKPQAYEGRAALKTYLIGILKFKLIDQFRSTQHNVSLSSEGDDDNDFEAFEALLYHKGHLSSPPPTWASPEGSMQEKHFFTVLEACVGKLPVQQGRAFMMREWLELSAEQICQELAISTTNYWALMSRARARLQECLNQHWITA